MADKILFTKYMRLLDLYDYINEVDFDLQVYSELRQLEKELKPYESRIDGLGGGFNE